MPQPNENQFGGLLRSSASGTTLLIIIQLTSRLITFAANQLILRKLSPAILGIAAQLELYLATILYFSRESIRIAIQRQPLKTVAGNQKNSGGDSNGKVWTEDSIASQSVVNVSYLGLGLGVPLAAMITLFYIRFTPERVFETPYCHTGVAITGAASLLELGVEPFFAVVQQHLLYKKRAVVEMSAAFIKSLAVCGTFIWASKAGIDVGVLPFALGHLFHAIVLICGYIVTMLDVAREAGFSFLLMRIQSRYATTKTEVRIVLTVCSNQSKYMAGRFSYQLVSLSANVFLQSAVKYLLTQGDSMILAAMSTLEDQGIYSLASNYGGLVARIIFQPIEESSRTLFSSLLSPGEGIAPDPGSINIAKTHMIDILRAYGFLSIIIFPLAPSLVPQILHLLGGHRWDSTEVDQLLTMYCYYIPFLGFNGITEAFVSSAASPSELRKQTGWMGTFSASFVLAAYAFLKIGNMGAQGLVWANIVNMVVRTTWSYLFINSYLRRHQNGLYLAEFGPRLHTQIAGIIATSVMLSKSGGLNDNPQSITRVIAFNAAYILFV